jgi:hypothetical protein
MTFRWFKSAWFFIPVATAVVCTAYLVWPLPIAPDPIWGVSFSKLHSDELGIDWHRAYVAILDDLGVEHVRLSAHWDMIEPERDRFDWSALDFQMNEAHRRDVQVVLATGRRLPNFPECHEPDWVHDLPVAERNERILHMVRQVVERYRDYENIRYWQVENETFLTSFADEYCGDLQEELLDAELALVRDLDSSRPILTTDSGELGRWYRAYRRGDVFGTTMYLYIWNRQLGQFRYPIDAWFFRAKQRLVRLFFEDKDIILAELAAEPWLLQSIKDVPLDFQFERMGVDKFREMVDIARRSGFSESYLWGAEWWYWLKEQGRREHWEYARELISQ